VEAIILVLAPKIELQAGELEGLIRRQGLPKLAFVPSAELPLSVSRHPQIAALGEGTYLITALSCYREEAEDLSEPGDPHVLIAPFARRNYYAEAVARLKGVVRVLCQRHGFSRQALRIFCNSPLPEKALAVLSGLGSYGKNTLILIPGMGSLFVIAGLFIPAKVTGIPEPSRRPAGGYTAALWRDTAELRFPLCGDCRSCQDACPVGALDEAGRLDESRCLQALCTEARPFSEQARRAWAYRFYGCQSCQDVCPYNRGLETQTVVQRGELGPSLSLKHLLCLPAEQFRETLRGSTLARSWIQPRTLLRNALVAAGNRRDPILLDAVAAHRASPDPLVAQAAAWALGSIGGRPRGGRD
jgi:epoxyqueuosine reductase